MSDKMLEVAAFILVKEHIKEVSRILPSSLDQICKSHTTKL